MRVAIAQTNPLVGDLEGNADQLLALARQAHGQGAELLVSPELSLWGYPPRDLLLRPALLQRQDQALVQLAQQLPAELTLLVGIAEPAAGQGHPPLFNAIARLQGGRWQGVYRKQLLPSYDVFDERRYFRPGEQPGLLEHRDRSGRLWRIGLSLCEDLWVEEELLEQRLAGADPIAVLVPLQPDLLLNLSASPFARGKPALRRRLAASAARRLGCPVLYVNQVGGNDELVFDGASFAVAADGALLCQLPCAAEALEIWSPPAASPAAASPAAASPAALAPATWPDPLEQLLRVLVLGVHDYARKCSFQRALLGLSGGIDSALVAVIAAAALGPEATEALLMPSPYSSRGSIDDALALAARLGIGTCTLPIGPLMEGFSACLQPALGGAPRGVTEENLQSRIRGTLLMALANQQGGLLLSTGNKSELAVGYCTLYGDMNGGLAVIGDLYKTTVFALCEWLDQPAAGPCRRSLGLPAQGELIGAAIRHKPPSAELRPDQRDSDSLPDYAVLDPLLKAYVEAHRTPEELVAEGVDPALARRVQRLLRRAEFKRRQAPPLLQVSGRAFGSGWRMPIAAAGD